MHIATASLDDAQRVLSAALSAGFRESGAVGLNTVPREPTSPIVAVRSMGLALDSIIGFQKNEKECVAIVGEAYLETLVAIANDRFRANRERMNRFRKGLLENYRQDDKVREDAECRRFRKRQEGLRRQEELKAERQSATSKEIVKDQSLRMDSLFN